MLTQSFMPQLAKIQSTLTKIKETLDCVKIQGAAEGHFLDARSIGHRTVIVNMHQATANNAVALSTAIEQRDDAVRERDDLAAAAEQKEREEEEAEVARLDAALIAARAKAARRAPLANIAN